MKLISQIQAIIFLAFPVEERERGESGRQMAKYLGYNVYYEVIGNICGSGNVNLIDRCFL